MPETDIEVKQEIKIEDCNITPSTYSSEPSQLTSVKKEEDFEDKYEHVNSNSSDSITDYNNDFNQDPVYIANFQGPQGRVFVFKKDRECHKIVLPESVLPDIFQSGGPVCLEVPNVGRLQIQSPPIEESGQNNLEEIKDEPLHDVEDSQNKTSRCNEMSKMENNSKKLELPKMKKPTTTNRKPHRRKERCKTTSESSAPSHQMSKSKNNKNKLELPNMTKVHRGKKKVKTISGCSAQSINQRSKRKIKNNRLNDYIYGKEKLVRIPTKDEKVIKLRYIPLQKDDVRVDSTNLKNEMNVNSYNRVLLEIMKKRISTCKELIDAFALIKPTLVINEHNYEIVDFTKDYCKANIVYALNQNNLFPKRLLREKYFCDAVMGGFIKIVDSELLTDYLIGHIGPEKYKSHFISLDIGRD